MVCNTCQGIPLDLFLPLRACGHSHSTTPGKRWFASHRLWAGQHCLDDLHASSLSGCQLCRIFETALSFGGSPSAISEFKSPGHGALLTGQQRYVPLYTSLQEPAIWVVVREQGEMMVVAPGKESGLYWRVDSLDSGPHLDKVHGRVDCEENFEMMRDWLATCSQTHSSCKENTEDNFLPTRLVYLGRNVEDPETPRLVVTKEEIIRSPEQSFAYVALSHCWGTTLGKTVLKTTKSTLASHIQGIDVKTLPKTFQDAMEASRRLKCPYIWIDSLCIIQDDRDDFERECSDMHRIYSSAYCTVSASDAAHGDEGVFLPRDPALPNLCNLRLVNHHIPYRPMSIMDCIFGRFDNDPESAEVTIYTNYGPWISSLADGAIFQRGWCLQERELSPRILHFTKNRLLWECRLCTASENQKTMREKNKNRSLATHLTSSRILDDTGYFFHSRALNGLPVESRKWEKLVEAYSKRSLSDKRDKLPALTGIATAFAFRRPKDVPEDQYLAGLWRSALLTSLSWTPDRSCRVLRNKIDDWPPSSADPCIPSWSWASYEGPIRFCGETWFDRKWVRKYADPDNESDYVWVKSDLDVSVENVDVNYSGQSRFGRVSSCEIVLNGWAVEQLQYSGTPLTASRSGEDKMSESEYSDYICGLEIGSPNLTIYLDVQVERLPPADYLFFQLGFGKNLIGTDRCVNGLMLMKVCTEESRARDIDVYQRVGLFDTSCNETSVSTGRTWLNSREKKQICIV